jgi:hypothetical protein
VDQSTGGTAVEFIVWLAGEVKPNSDVALSSGIFRFKA